MSNPTLSHAYTDEEGSVHCNTRVYRGECECWETLERSVLFAIHSEWQHSIFETTLTMRRVRGNQVKYQSWLCLLHYAQQIRSHPFSNRTHSNPCGLEDTMCAVLCSLRLLRLLINTPMCHRKHNPDYSTLSHFHSSVPWLPPLTKQLFSYRNLHNTHVHMSNTNHYNLLQITVRCDITK